MRRFALLFLLGGLIGQPIYFTWEAADRLDRARHAEDAKLLRVLDIYGRSIIGLVESRFSVPSDSETAAVYKQRVLAQAALDKSAREMLDRRSRIDPASPEDTRSGALRLIFNPGYCLVLIGSVLLLIDIRRSTNAKTG